MGPEPQGLLRDYAHLFLVVANGMLPHGIHSIGSLCPGFLGSSPRYALPLRETWNKAAKEQEMNDFSMEENRQWDTSSRSQITKAV